LVCDVHVFLPRMAQREGDGAPDMRGQCDSVVGARWQ